MCSPTKLQIRRIGVSRNEEEGRSRREGEEEGQSQGKARREVKDVGKNYQTTTIVCHSNIKIKYIHTQQHQVPEAQMSQLRQLPIW
jgi:hypothetical protein